MSLAESLPQVNDEVITSLRKLKIRSTTDLLLRGGSPIGRREIAREIGISEQRILEWVNHVDLYRIKGVGSEYADLLEEAGVDTVVELATRNPANLHKAMVDTNAKKDLVRKLPTEDQVKDWIEQAKKMDRKVSY